MTVSIQQRIDDAIVEILGRVRDDRSYRINEEQQLALIGGKLPFGFTVATNGSLASCEFFAQVGWTTYVKVGVSYRERNYANVSIESEACSTVADHLGDRVNRENTGATLREWRSNGDVSQLNRLIPYTHGPEIEHFLDVLDRVVAEAHKRMVLAYGTNTTEEGS